MHAEVGLTAPDKPAGSYLLLGPTGVGKTETAKAVADGLHTGLARWDLSELRTGSAVDLFLGARGEPGRFAREIARSGNARVLLFDEFEKAHPDLHDLFLQMTDEARLTTADGRTHDLRHRHLFLTSNLGAGAAARMRFNSTDTIHATVTAYARRALRPEMFARLDVVAVFSRLSLSSQETICDRMLDAKLQAIAQRGLNLEADASVRRFLLAQGFTDADGARPLQQSLERLVNRAILPVLGGMGSLRGRLRVNTAGTELEVAAC